jgi:uncharacterized protein
MDETGTLSVRHHAREIRSGYDHALLPGSETVTSGSTGRHHGPAIEGSRIWSLRMTLETRLRSALTQAMKSRDDVARSAIRSALAAIDNAGALGIVEAADPQADWQDGSSEWISGGVRGLGTAEVQRRPLSEEQTADIVQCEISNRNRAADEYEQRGRFDEARRLRDESTVLDRVLSEQHPG